MRRLVGYYRYDSKEEVALLNQLYQKVDLLDNFFIASAKLRIKVRDSKGRVIKRIHDTPKTPYQRLVESKDISSETKQALRKLYSFLSMVKLREKIERVLDKLFKIQQEKYREKTEDLRKFQGKNYELTRTRKMAF